MIRWSPKITFNSWMNWDVPNVNKHKLPSGVRKDIERHNKTVHVGWRDLKCELIKIFYRREKFSSIKFYFPSWAINQFLILLFQTMEIFRLKFAHFLSPFRVVWSFFFYLSPISFAIDNLLYLCSLFCLNFTRDK